MKKKMKDRQKITRAIAICQYSKKIFRGFFMNIKCCPIDL